MALRRAKITPTVQEKRYITLNFLESAYVSGTRVVITPVKSYSLTTLSGESFVYGKPVETWIIYDERPAVRLLKNLGWYREDGESNPQIAYIPTHLLYMKYVWNIGDNVDTIEPQVQPVDGDKWADTENELLWIYETDTWVSYAMPTAWYQPGAAGVWFYNDKTSLLHRSIFAWDYGTTLPVVQPTTDLIEGLRWFDKDTDSLYTYIENKWDSGTIIPIVQPTADITLNDWYWDPNGNRVRRIISVQDTVEVVSTSNPGEDGATYPVIGDQWIDTTTPGVTECTLYTCTENYTWTAATEEVIAYNTLNPTEPFDIGDQYYTAPFLRTVTGLNSQIVYSDVPTVRPESPTAGDVWYDEISSKVHIYVDAGWDVAEPVPTDLYDPMAADLLYFELATDKLFISTYAERIVNEVLLDGPEMKLLVETGESTKYKLKSLEVKRGTLLDVFYDFAVDAREEAISGGDFTDQQTYIADGGSFYKQYTLEADAGDFTDGSPYDLPIDDSIVINRFYVTEPRTEINSINYTCKLMPYKYQAPQEGESTQNESNGMFMKFESDDFDA